MEHAVKISPQDLLKMRELIMKDNVLKWSDKKITSIANDSIKYIQFVISVLILVVNTS